MCKTETTNATVVSYWYDIVTSYYEVFESISIFNCILLIYYPCGQQRPIPHLHVVPSGNGIVVPTNGGGTEDKLYNRILTVQQQRPEKAKIALHPLKARLKDDRKAGTWPVTHTAPQYSSYETVLRSGDLPRDMSRWVERMSARIGKPQCSTDRRLNGPSKQQTA